jgi:hypothetical protein
MSELPDRWLQLQIHVGVAYDRIARLDTHRLETHAPHSHLHWTVWCSQALIHARRLLETSRRARTGAGKDRTRGQGRAAHLSVEPHLSLQRLPWQHRFAETNADRVEGGPLVPAVRSQHCTAADATGAESLQDNTAVAQPLTQRLVHMTTCTCVTASTHPYMPAC